MRCRNSYELFPEGVKRGRRRGSAVFRLRQIAFSVNAGREGLLYAPVFIIALRRREHCG